MRNHNITRSCILALLLFVFSFAQAQLVITPNVTPVCHSSDGAVTISLSGGTSGYHFYMYATSGTYYPTQTSPTFTGLSSGLYQIYVYGSIDSGSLLFNVPNQVGISVTDVGTTCPLNAGSITAAGSGGASPYTYFWSTGAATAGISGLGGGPYTVTVTDANGCSAKFDTSITATSPMSVSISNNGVVCNPTLTGVATGGTGTVTYHWNNGASTSAVTNLGNSGSYAVTATDANGCTARASTGINITSLLIDSSTSTITYPGCTGSLGSINAQVQNGTAPYTYQWTGGTTGNPLTNLSVGTYAVTVTDANGCQGHYTYYLSSQNQVGIYVNTYSNPTCGASDGYINVYTYYGTAPFTYQWSNSSTSANLSNAPSGSYSVTVTDAGGCSATASQALRGILPSVTATVTTTPTACDTALHTGTATVTVTGTGGTAPYSFVWTSGYPGMNNPPVVGTTQTITNLSYYTWVSVSVTDANGCVPGNTIADSTFIPLDPACFDHITGYAFNDLNGNCIMDAGEPGLGGVNISAGGNSGNWGNTDSTGYYDITVLPGTYTVTEASNAYGYCVASLCNTSYTVNFTNTGTISTGNNFGQNGASASDLGVHMGYIGSAPGGTKEYWVYYYNRGSVASTGSVLTFIHDANITLTSTTPPYTSYNSATQTITWNIGSVPVSYWNNAQQVTMNFDIPSTLALGTPLFAHTDITPIAGDCNPSDNTQDLTDIVSGSHDPNEKEVSPSGNLTESDSVLTYTIRFQNNGNAPASRIVVTDTLSANVNAGTVEPGASSHSYKFVLSGKGVLTFTFDNINLPDSVHDVAHSKGFVMYTVHTKKNIALGTQVKNTAYIYFDINPAVVTNTTNSTRSDFQTGIKSVTGNDDMTVSVSPNPIQDKGIVHISGATGSVSFDLTDVRGQKVMEVTTADKGLTLESEMFAAGMYIYTAKDAMGRTRSGKITITH